MTDIVRITEKVVITDLRQGPTETVVITNRGPQGQPGPPGDEGPPGVISADPPISLVDGVLSIDLSALAHLSGATFSSDIAVVKVDGYGGMRMVTPVGFDGYMKLNKIKDGVEVDRWRWIATGEAEDTSGEHPNIGSNLSLYYTDDAGVDHLVLVIRREDGMAHFEQKISVNGADVADMNDIATVNGRINILGSNMDGLFEALDIAHAYPDLTSLKQLGDAIKALQTAVGI